MTTFTDVRVAREPHVPGTKTGGCDACRSTIQPGETYARWSATPRDSEVNQGEHWSHLKTHYPAYESCPKFRALPSTEDTK